MKNKYDINTGLKTGLWKEKIDNCSCEGNYVNGLREGYWKEYENDKLIYYGEYKNGLMEGYWFSSDNNEKFFYKEGKELFF